MSRPTREGLIVELNALEQGTSQNVPMLSAQAQKLRDLIQLGTLAKSNKNIVVTFHQAFCTLNIWADDIDFNNSRQRSLAEKMTQKLYSITEGMSKHGGNKLDYLNSAYDVIMALRGDINELGPLASPDYYLGDSAADFLLV